MSIVENLNAVKTAIEKAARTHGQNAAAVNIVAVSKQQTIDKIRACLQAGQRIFGENRVQEALSHWSDLKKEYPDAKLHLIGPLQTNKVKEAVALFDVIETLDREKLADALSAEMKKQNRNLPCFIQVNTGEEDQKSGILPKDLPAFLNYCVKECDLHVTGLMCIPPVDDPPAMHFALLKKLAHENNMKDLSMGMSGDFEKAVALGSNYIRLGTVIFGERIKK
jgi:pyridoxal phosphate enzyme (YggS family)